MHTIRLLQSPSGNLYFTEWDEEDAIVAVSDPMLRSLSFPGNGIGMNTDEDSIEWALAHLFTPTVSLKLSPVPSKAE